MDQLGIMNVYMNVRRREMWRGFITAEKALDEPQREKRRSN